MNSWLNMAAGIAQVAMPLVNLITLIFLAYQLYKNFIAKKNEFMIGANNKIESHRELRYFLANNPDCNDTNLDEWKTKIRDYMIVFEELHMLIYHRIITRDEFRCFFGKRFQEFYNHKIVKKLLTHEELKDMDCVLEDLSGIVPTNARSINPPRLKK